MRKFVLLAVIFVLVASMATAVYAAPPPDGPPGLQHAIEVKDRYEDYILEIEGVAGVAIGHNGNATPSVLVFMETPGVRGLPSYLEGVPVVPMVSGKIVALPKPPGTPGGKPPKDEDPPVDPTARFDRPVPIGVSTGHPDITAGTIGARVTDGTSVYALSNNHVYANENLASNGDAVIQPGTFDFGASPADDIGTLFDFEPIVFSESASNVIDAAIASSTTLLLDKSTPIDGYGIPRSNTVAPSINMKVKKYGRTTGLTKGQIFAINATVNVGYSSGTARFVNQIIITPGDFSAGGDSGSLIVVDGKGRDRADNKKPLGLLFAGSDLFTIANPIAPVLDRFGVIIDGE